MTIEDQLLYFLAAARREHLGRAAEELGLSQPALSRSISRLEKEYGTRLFDRGGRRIKLNAAGRILFEHFGRAADEFQNARLKLMETKSENRNTVSIGFLATFGAQLIPDLIRSFKMTEPAARFRLLQGPYPLLHDELVAGKMDFCLVAPRFRNIAIDWQPLFDEELVIIVPKAHRLAARGQIDLCDVAKEPMIALKTGYGLRQTLDDLTRDAGFVPEIAFESEEIATLQGLVGAGFGIALTTSGSVGRSDLVVSLAVRKPACRRTVGLAWRHSRYVSRKGLSFKEHVVKTLVVAGRN